MKKCTNRRLPGVLALITVAAISFACLPALQGGELGVKSPSGYRIIKVDDLKRMLEHKDFVLINVSFRCTGYIPNTDRDIPFNLIDRYPEMLPEPDKARIVLYCNRGYMSRVAAKKLTAMGYKDVYILDGGLEKWELAGNKVIDRR